MKEVDAKTEEKAPVYNVDSDTDGTIFLVAERDGDEVVLPSRPGMRFMLCSTRCARKCHYGSVVDDTFKCAWYDLPEAERADPVRRMAHDVAGMLTRTRPE